MSRWATTRRRVRPSTTSRPRPRPTRRRRASTFFGNARKTNNAVDSGRGRVSRAAAGGGGNADCQRGTDVVGIWQSGDRYGRAGPRILDGNQYRHRRVWSAGPSRSVAARRSRSQRATLASGPALGRGGVALAVGRVVHVQRSVHRRRPGRRTERRSAGALTVAYTGAVVTGSPVTLTRHGG